MMFHPSKNEEKPEKHNLTKSLRLDKVDQKSSEDPTELVRHKTRSISS